MFNVLYLIATSIAVVYLILRPKKKKDLFEEPKNLSYLADIKTNGDRYVVALDHADFKDSSFLSEIEQDNSDYKIAANLVGSNIGSYYTPMERVETVQSVLFYKINDRQFYQTFHMDLITLKYHVMCGHVLLYVSKNDPVKYCFDIIAE